jgi:hypothetical protein
VLGVFDGVTVFIRHGIVEIDTEPDCCPTAFRQALDLVGASGRTDYVVRYDPETGVETYSFLIVPVPDEPPDTGPGVERVPWSYRFYEAAAFTEQYVQEIGMRHVVRTVSLALRVHVGV